MSRKAKKKPKKVPLRVLLRRLHKKADKAVSDYARALAKREFGGFCPFCGADPTVPVWNKKKTKLLKNRWICFHFVRRKRKSVRWSMRNVIGACEFCNLRERGNPDPYRAWYIGRYGVDAYLALVEESKKDFEPTAQFLTCVIMAAESELAKLEAERDA